MPLSQQPYGIQQPGDINLSHVMTLPCSAKTSTSFLISNLISVSEVALLPCPAFIQSRHTSYIVCNPCIWAMLQHTSLSAILAGLTVLSNGVHRQSSLFYSYISGLPTSYFNSRITVGQIESKLFDIYATSLTLCLFHSPVPQRWSVLLSNNSTAPETLYNPMKKNLEQKLHHLST